VHEIEDIDEFTVSFREENQENTDIENIISKYNNSECVKSEMEQDEAIEIIKLDEFDVPETIETDLNFGSLNSMVVRYFYYKNFKPSEMLLNFGSLYDN
jgi:hypothetical protein